MNGALAGMEIVTIELFLLENEIDGASFCELTEQEIKSMIKPIGVVKRILRLQNTVSW